MRRILDFTAYLVYSEFAMIEARSGSVLREYVRKDVAGKAVLPKSVRIFRPYGLVSGRICRILSQLWSAIVS